LVYGEKDEQTPVRYGELFHEKMSNTTLEILPGVDHFLYQNEEPQVIKLVEDFLK